jgi:hypothetical protein
MAKMEPIVEDKQKLFRIAECFSTRKQIEMPKKTVAL